MADAYVKQNDTWPALGELDPVILKFGPEGEEAAIPLSGSSIKFLARKIDDPLVTIEGACTIVGDPTLGQVKYQWALDGSDTAVAGDYQFEFQITFGDGRIGTSPTEGYYELKITDDIGD